MSTKFSQFTSGGLLLTTDIVVGLRGGNNFQFDNLTGIGDALGNKIITWFQAVGVGNAVNYTEFQNNFAGLSPQISAKGTDTNIDLTLNAKGSTGFVKVSGTGALFVPIGTTGQRPIGSGGMVRVNSTTGLFEFWNPVNSDWESSGSSILSNLTFVTNTDETVDLPNSQPLSALATGIMKVTTATGIVSSLAIPLTEANGGTAQSAYVLGDTLYASGVNTLAKLAGNITAAKQYLSQTGTGAVSAAPVWATISGGDITGAALTKVDDTNVTLALGGTPATALLRAASLTLGWTGILSVARGGTAASSFTAYMPICGGTTSTNPLQSVSTSGALAGYKLTYVSSAALPTWQPDSSSAVLINQAAHGFVVGDVLYLNSTTYTKAQANAASTAEVVGVVSAVIDVDNFILISVGRITGLAGLTAGSVYFLSDATPGLATLTEPTTVGNISKPVWIADTTTSAFIYQERGKIIPSASTSFTDVSLAGSTTAADRVTYEINGAGLVTITIPATTAVGFTFTVVGNSAPGWVIQANTGQTLHIGSTTTTSGGTVTFANRYDCITVKCTVANTTFSCYGVQGSPTTA